MSFKYNEGGEIIEIIIRENSGAKIETYKFQVDDKKRASYLMGNIMKKYGLTTQHKDKDLDWLSI